MTKKFVHLHPYLHKDEKIIFAFLFCSRYLQLLKD